MEGFAELRIKFAVEHPPRHSLKIQLTLQPQQPLVAPQQPVPLPDAAHRRRRGAHAHQPQLLADAQVAVAGELLGPLQNLPFQLWRRLVGHPRPVAAAAG